MASLERRHRSQTNVIWSRAVMQSMYGIASHELQSCQVTVCLHSREHHRCKRTCLWLRHSRSNVHQSPSWQSEQWISSDSRSPPPGFSPAEPRTKATRAPDPPCSETFPAGFYGMKGIEICGEKARNRVENFSNTFSTRFVPRRSGRNGLVATVHPRISRVAFRRMSSWPGGLRSLIVPDEYNTTLDSKASDNSS